jgi:hypothetical protein
MESGGNKQNSYFSFQFLGSIDHVNDSVVKVAFVPTGKGKPAQGAVYLLPVLGKVAENCRLHVIAGNGRPVAWTQSAHESVHRMVNIVEKKLVASAELDEHHHRNIRFHG